MGTLSEVTAAAGLARSRKKSGKGASSRKGNENKEGGDESTILCPIVMIM
jgi:hypothetical protein